MAGWSHYRWELVQALLLPEAAPGCVVLDAGFVQGKPVIGRDHYRWGLVQALLLLEAARGCVVLDAGFVQGKPVVGRDHYRWGLARSWIDMGPEGASTKCRQLHD